MVFCTSCGTKLNDGVKFCTGCSAPVGGAPSQPAAQVTQQQTVLQTQSITADEKYCFSCGSVIKKIAEICSRCGVRQSQLNKIPSYVPKLVLVAVILFAFRNVASFTYSVFRLAYRTPITLLLDLIGIGSFIIGIAVCVKVKKNIGATVSYTAAILFGVLCLVEIYYLFQYFKYLF